MNKQQPTTKVDRAFETLRSDPRYAEMARKLGVTPAHSKEMYDAEKQRQWGQSTQAQQAKSE